MATVTKLSSNMQLQYSMGVDTEGNEILRRKTFKGFKHSVLDDDIYAVSQQFDALQEPSIVQVKRIDESLIDA